MNRKLTVSDEVATALDSLRPVVALESTIISHGMPYPDNLETARECERILRDMGVAPATCAVLDGRLRVGLSDGELLRLAEAKDVVKASRRDLPLLAANGGSGACTVAATMILAHMAGIRVFATGGIGGVHRGAETTMDISADLEELARTPVAVVCAGPKSILDIGLTLEYLETKGVPVIGYQTDVLPAFYTRESAFSVDARMDTPAEVAAAVAAMHGMRIGSGMLVAVPVPEESSLPASELDGALAVALADASREGISGKRLTPYLLSRLGTVTEGRTLKTNKALVFNNVRVAGEIAKKLYEE